mmetsp:Transcript_91612/g.273365  ORF Transcript_91612/g.273365 Transcript_91612/m.273365 type:complete len:276 (+) Transcript_91612:173-1000(+)
MSPGLRGGVARPAGPGEDEAVALDGTLPERGGPGRLAPELHRLLVPPSSRRSSRAPNTWPSRSEISSACCASCSRSAPFSSRASSSRCCSSSAPARSAWPLEALPPGSRRGLLPRSSLLAPSSSACSCRSMACASSRATVCRLSSSACSSSCLRNAEPLAASPSSVPAAAPGTPAPPSCWGAGAGAHKLAACSLAASLSRCPLHASASCSQAAKEAACDSSACCTCFSAFSLDCSSSSWARRSTFTNFSFSSSVLRLNCSVAASATRCCAKSCSS